MSDPAGMQEIIRQYGVSDRRVLEAMACVDRAEFAGEENKSRAYEDTALPIGHDQWISQPYTVARMLELLIFNFQFSIFNSKVLEIGTGSGWQTALLAKLFKRVYSIEIVPELARLAEMRIEKSDLRNVKIKIGDGKEGWKKYAPYEAIICGADAEEVPGAWMEQLAAGGRIVTPVRGVMTRVTKIRNPKNFKTEKFENYVFVPLV